MFKVGDKVKCINPAFGLVYGGIYTVHKAGRYCIRVTEALEHLPGHLLDVGRFELAESSTQETDPSGLSASAPGAKLDAGKVMAAQILAQFPRALHGVAEVGSFGARKYSMGGWQHVENGFARYEDAQFRHFLKRNMGETVDPDSQLDHLKHEAWNALAKLELYLRDKETK